MISSLKILNSYICCELLEIEGNKPTKRWAVEQGRLYFITNIVNHILEHKQAGKLLTKISSKMEKYDSSAFKINLENIWYWEKLGWIHP